MKEFEFKITSKVVFTINDLGTDKKGIREDLIKNLKLGKYDKLLKKDAKVSIGRKK